MMIKPDKYVDLEMYNQHLQELEQSVQLADEQLEYAAISLDVIKELGSAKVGQELLVPFGNGVFLTVLTSDIENVKFGVGAGVVVDKSTSDAKKYIEDRVKELTDYREQSLVLFDQVATKALALQKDIEKTK